MLNQQLAIKDSQIKEKDEQLNSMQKLLDQSQQLQLMTEKKVEELETTTSIKIKYDNLNLKQKSNAWWKFWLKNKT
ncbi:RepB* [Lactobacillus helveticus]|uniref:RepB n=2 Tax=Lactobacillus helveticus TaxID=1587 RepID=A0A3Q8SVY3_LACHE|nr:RepB* [Lactobacillus helveticus]ADL14568.1 RepB* [Lactobacillus helveticus R0052]AZK92452.1 hypothetical protein LH5_02266 [Lactobacillus helveticus]